MRTFKSTRVDRVRAVGVPAAVSSMLLAGIPALAADQGRSFEIYGFAQADYIQDITGRLDPDWDDAFRPSKICFDEACGKDGQARNG